MKFIFEDRTLAMQGILSEKMLRSSLWFLQMLTAMLIKIYLMKNRIKYSVLSGFGVVSLILFAVVYWRGSEWVRI